MLSSHPSYPTFISCWQKVLAVSPLEKLHAAIEKMSNSVSLFTHHQQHCQHLLIWCIRHFVFSAVHLEVGHVVRKPCDEDGALFAAATVRHRLRLDDRPGFFWTRKQWKATFPTRFDVISFLRQTETFIVHKHTTHSPKKPSSFPIPIHPLGAHLTKPLISLGAPCSPLLSWLRPLPRLPFISLL